MSSAPVGSPMACLWLDYLCQFISEEEGAKLRLYCARRYRYSSPVVLDSLRTARSAYSAWNRLIDVHGLSGEDKPLGPFPVFYGDERLRCGLPDSDEWRLSRV